MYNTGVLSISLVCMQTNNVIEEHITADQDLDIIRLTS